MLNYHILDIYLYYSNVKVNNDKKNEMKKQSLKIAFLQGQESLIDGDDLNQNLDKIVILNVSSTDSKFQTRLQ